MGIIQVFVDDEALIIDNALSWCKENDIVVLKFKARHSENVFDRAIIYGFDFFFENEEDAVAFKLRWT